MRATGKFGLPIKGRIIAVCLPDSNSNEAKRLFNAKCEQLESLFLAGVRQ